jgi:hypothetical protein
MEDKMTTPTMTDFDAAKSIADTLRPFERDKQEQILRWVAESLGLPTTHHQRVAAGSPVDTKPVHTAVASGLASTPLGNYDIRSFVAEKQPKSDNQFAAVVAYFYRFIAPEYERRDRITADVLQDATRKAGRDRLPRPDATLNNATVQGYLDRAGRGEFAINTVGENLVAMALPGTDTNLNLERRHKDSNRKTKSRKSGKSKRK